MPRLRVLFLASFFPKPTNPLMGTWALTQARALARQNIDLRVVSFSAWMPRVAARLGSGARAYAECPREWDWDGQRVEYPRWLLAPVGPLKAWAFRCPEPSMRLAALSARPFLSRVLDEWKPDIIFAHHTLANGFLAEAFTRKSAIPFVTLDHDFGEIADCAHLPARKQTFARISNRAARSLAVSNRMEQGMRALFPDARVQTQHTGVEPLPDSVQSAPRLPELGGKTVILSAGMFYPRKGFPLLVEAFAQIAPKYPGAILRLAGDGEEGAQVDALIARLKLGGQIERLGMLPHERVLQEMAWADVFASPGWDEPFATVFLEAAAARCALLWANDGGINDVLKNGLHGQSVSPRDVSSTARALDELLGSPDKREEMAGRAHALFEEKLGADAVAASLVELFERVVEERAANGA